MLTLCTFIFYRLKNNEGRYITRQYTPVSLLSQTDHFDVLIKVRVINLPPTC